MAATLMNSDPFAPPTYNDQSTSDWLLCEDDQVNLGGWGWPSCRQMIFANRLRLDFLTQTMELPTKNILMLKSEGKGHNRTLRIVHDCAAVSETIRIFPHYPKRWYEIFEQLGIPTEDATGLRESSQLSLRSSRWTTNIEGVFWGLVFVGSFVAGAASLLLSD